MGNCSSGDYSNNPTPFDKYQDNKNVHTFNPELKIHAVVSHELDIGARFTHRQVFREILMLVCVDHENSMKIPLGDCTDEQLLAEVPLLLRHAACLTGGCVRWRGGTSTWWTR